MPMLRFSRNDAAPAERKARLVDAAGTKAWLAGMAVPLTVENLAEIEQVLRALGAPDANPGAAILPPERKFAIAERIRGVLLQVLHERDADDRLAVLPLDDDHVLHLWAAVDAAVALRDVYAWLVTQLPDAPILGEPTLPSLGLPQAAAAAPTPPTFVSSVGALQRALDVGAQVLIGIQRARSPVPAQIWERHCVLGQRVRDLDCQDVEVADALHASITRTCRSAFVMPVMVALADPSARSAAEFDVIRMGAQRWSAKVGFRIERHVESVPAAVVAPARPVPSPGPTITLGSYLLKFDTQSAMVSIDKRLDALAVGKTPREVGIGDALRPQAARDVLLLMRHRWGAVSPANVDSPDRPWRTAPPGVRVTAIVGMPTRQAPRRDGDRPKTVGGAAASPYAYQRGGPAGVTRTREEIERERIEQLLAGAETWTLAAEASDAVRCVRRYARPRIGLQRLIGLRLGSAGQEGPFLVGWVEALQGVVADPADPGSRHSGAHAVRIRLAPGLPQMLHASIDDVEVDAAFLLVPSPAAHEPGRPTAAPVLGIADPHARLSGLDGDDGEGWDAVRASPRDYGLILPHAAFRPRRFVKAGRRGAVATLRLEELMMRGSDFDLVRFTPL